MRALQAALPHRSPKSIKNWFNNNKHGLRLDKLLVDRGHQLPTDKRTVWA
jgi:hypothetical protein